MADFKEFIKNNKKNALAFAVVAAFSVGIAGTATSCENRYRDEDENGNTSRNYGVRRSFWHPFGGGRSYSSSSSSSYSSSDGSSSSSNKSSVSKSSGGKSSGYSGAKGGSSSS